MKITSASSVCSIQQELGERLKQARLNKNLSQKYVSEVGGLSLYLVGQVEKGEGTMESMIRYLKAVGMVESISAFIPPITVSPIELAKHTGKGRKRASGEGEHQQKEEGDDW